MGRRPRSGPARGTMGSMADVTGLLHAAAAGDPKAAADLLPLVYDELRKLAAARMAGEKPGQTIQATALVHDAYLRLVGPDPDRDWNGRGHFFAAAAEAMRRILVENARRKQAEKHGGGRRRQDLDPDAAGVAKLRIFAGLSVEEAAQALSMSRASAYRQWSYARAWLHARLGAGLVERLRPDEAGGRDVPERRIKKARRERVQVEVAVQHRQRRIRG